MIFYNYVYTNKGCYIMLMYKTQKDLRLETRNRYETKTQLRLKQREKEQQKTILKRILKVYKKDDHFFIEPASAYALHLTQARAVFSENSNFHEISKEQLDEYINNSEYEIEYYDYLGDLEHNDTSGPAELRKSLESLEQGKYGIGVHAIHSGSPEEKQNKAEEILKNNLSLATSVQSILSTAISLGESSDAQVQAQEAIDYTYGFGAKLNVILAVPEVIQNAEGQKIFLGFPQENKRTSAQQYEPQCILDRICAKLGYVPKEFILGYYSQSDDEHKSFIPNPNHISKLPKQEIDSLYSILYANMDFITRDLNDMISQGKIEQLENSKETMHSRGVDTAFIDNLILLAKKNIPIQKGRRIISLQSIATEVSKNRSDKDI